MKISYTKIDGCWLLKITGSAAERAALTEGQQIDVAKRDGSTKTEILGHLVDIQQDYVICAIGAAQQPAQRGFSRGGDGIERTYKGGNLTMRNPRTGRIWRERNWG